MTSDELQEKNILLVTLYCLFREVYMGKPHHKLNVWLKAVAFVKNIYQVIGEFPAEEKFGLVSQMRRSAISIASNIAPEETIKRKSDSFWVLPMEAYPNWKHN